MADDALAAIARLDAQLAASQSVVAPPPKLSARVGWFFGGLGGGAMFGGALAGPTGVPFCAALGAIAGGFRAVTGRSLLEYLSDDVSSSKAPLFALGPASSMAMPQQQAVATSCGATNAKHCAG